MFIVRSFYGRMIFESTLYAFAFDMDMNYYNLLISTVKIKEKYEEKINNHLPHSAA